MNFKIKAQLGLVSFFIFIFLSSATCIASQKSPWVAFEPAFTEVTIPANTSNGYALKDCEDPAVNFHSVKTNAKGEILKHCLPDTLYSWGTIEKVDYYARYFGLLQWGDLRETFERPLFTWRTPLGTFGYGKYALRIKLKANTKFKRLIIHGMISVKDFCDSELEKNYSYENVYVMIGDNTDTEKNNYSWVDYVICSAHPIASISFATTEHFKEMLREFTWLKTNREKSSHQSAEFESYIHSESHRGFLRYLDNKLWEMRALDENLEIMHRLVQNHSGIIFYNYGVKRSSSHFFTKHPQYFNRQSTRK